MNSSKEPNSSQPAARRTELCGSADARAGTENPQTFDCTLPTMVRQLEAMVSAGWLTGVTEASSDLR
ncbi:hypothetical protein DFR75_11916 [Nocardia ignorata]|uniref:Uncharacterized protein n=1 Tax=Nocardia ignorata TaxID=145285 RepID=A0A4R6NYZ9_NOCIG|nr:hypothetical protein DFR75_11916 [Nocardia ignorata]